MDINAEVFGNALRTAMEECRISNLAAAQKSGKQPAAVSQLKAGRVNPTIGVFCQVLTACEELHPGFFKVFAAKLAGISLPSRQFSPQDIVDPLDASQLAALLNAIGTRIVIDSKKVEKNEKKDKDKVA